MSTTTQKNQQFGPGFRRLVSIGVIWIALFFVYGSIVHHEFQCFDDGLYVFDNSYVQDGLTWDGVAWAFQSVDAANWHPLTWLSHMTDVQLFGRKPAGHFWMNILYQGAAAMALLYFLRLTPIGYWSALAVTLLWTIHPTNVESVAWLGQRKTLVCGVFFFLSLALYLRWQKEKSFRMMGFSAVCAILAVMAKPSAVVIPIILLALDIWPGQRIVWDHFAPRRLWQGVRDAFALIWEKWIFFLVSVMAAGVTFFAQDDVGATAMSYKIPIYIRLASCVEALWEYLGKSIGSVETSLLYALREPQWLVVAAGALLTGAIIWLGWRLRRSSPWVLASAIIFFGSFLPVIGLVQVGMQRMADRYIYFPLVGILIIIVMFGRSLCLRDRATARAVQGIFALWLVVLGLQAKGYVYLWGDSVALYRNAEVVGGSSYAMRINQGVTLYMRGQYSDARKVFSSVVNDTGATLNLAMVDVAENKIDEGVLRLRRLLNNRGYHLSAGYALSVIYLRTDRFEDARRALLFTQRQIPATRSWKKKVEDIRVEVPALLELVKVKLAEQAKAASTSPSLALAHE